MMDQWTDRLSEYLDGDLPALETRELEQHLEGCFECRRVLGELRAVVQRASALPDAEPDTELWSGIAARLGTAPVQLNDLNVIDLRARQRDMGSGMWDLEPKSQIPNPKSQRRITFSLPQLAAAAIALMVLSGSLVWVVLGRSAAPVVASAPAPAAGTRTVSNTPESLQQYAGAVAQLESVLRSNRDKLDPVTVAILEENLKSIDAAITEARGALERDPGNLYLNQHLENTMKKKIQLLRRANTLRGTAI